MSSSCAPCPCKLCAIPLARELLTKCEQCPRRKPHTFQYAAVDSTISNLQLPFVHALSACRSGGTATTHCIYPHFSFVSNLIAICSSVTNISCIVHITDEACPDPNLLLSLTDACSSVVRQVPVVVAKCSFTPGTASHTSFSVYSNSADTILGVSENRFISAVSDIASTSRCLIWCWDQELLGYSVAITKATDTLWVYESSHLPAWESGTAGSVRLMHPFHQDFTAGPIVVLKSQQPPQLQAPAAHTVHAQLKCLSSEVVGAASKTGRCFCCQYLIQCHTKVAGDDGGRATHETLQLLGDFSL